MAVKVNVPPTSIDCSGSLMVTTVTSTAAAVTVTATLAVKLPSAVVTVMVAAPSLSAVTRPSTTEAIAGWLLSHVTALLVALAGSTVGVKVKVPPSTRYCSGSLMVTPVTGTAASVTVTVAVPFFLLPSLAVAVMTAVPVPAAVTKPVALTVAVTVLLLVHVTDLSSASSGATVAVNCCVPPTVSAAVAGLTVTFVASTAPSSSSSQLTGNNSSGNSRAAAHTAVSLNRRQFFLKNFVFIILKFNLVYKSAFPQPPPLGGGLGWGCCHGMIALCISLQGPFWPVVFSQRRQQ